MIYNHNLLPVTTIGIPGPPVHPIESLSPKNLKHWADSRGRAGDIASPVSLAGERRIRAFGFGSQRWDLQSTPYFPPGWLHDMQDHTQARNDLLTDINDMITMYNNLTGSACLFLATHPEHDPKLAPEDQATYLFKRNTVIIPGDNVSDNKEVILDIAKLLTETVALPWRHEWESRAISSRISGSSATPAPKAFTPTTVPHRHLEAWLSNELTRADRYSPESLGRDFLGESTVLEWAEWLMEMAYIVPPAQLTALIEQEAKVQSPLAEVLASAALQSLTT
ncbi:hypothetical protein JB92DRAFT_3109914 [Gautieria morchelliformis]|nr:hypothetical protein JB92DRAFT_3109914 [Gautieria morchelliformis]